MRHVSVAIALGALSVGAAWAQEETGEFRTAVSVVGGLSVGSSRSVGAFDGRFGPGLRGSDAGFAVGGGIAHDFSPRLTLEATGVYLDRGASAWSADAGFRLNLTASGESIVPYFAASGGVYSDRSRTTTVERPIPPPDRDDRTPGRRGPFVTDGRDIASAAGARRSDALLSLGGGVRFAAGPHVFVRPDLRAQMVFAGDTRVRGLFTLSFGYRF